MLFWLFVIVFVGCLIGAIYFYYIGHEDTADTFMILMIPAFIAVVISLIGIGANNIGLDAKIEANHVRYEMLKYQYENDMYDNDNNVGKYELIKDIRSWNENLSKNKKLQRDFWIGIYIPNIYDDFEFISLEK